MLSLPLNYFLESICSISQASNYRMVLCLATYPAMRGVAPRCIALNLTRLRGLFEPPFYLLGFPRCKRSIISIPMGQTINSVVCHMLKALYSAAVWAVPAFRNSRWGIRG